MGCMHTSLSRKDIEEHKSKRERVLLKAMSRSQKYAGLLSLSKDDVVAIQDIKEGKLHPQKEKLPKWAEKLIKRSFLVIDIYDEARFYLVVVPIHTLCATRRREYVKTHYEMEFVIIAIKCKSRKHKNEKELEEDNEHVRIGENIINIIKSRKDHEALLQALNTLHIIRQ